MNLYRQLLKRLVRKTTCMVHAEYCKSALCNENMKQLKKILPHGSKDCFICCTNDKCDRKKEILKYDVKNN